MLHPHLRVGRQRDVLLQPADLKWNGRERAEMKPHLNIGSVLLFTADLTNYVSLRVRMVKRGNRGMLWKGEEIPETTNCIHAWRIESMMVEQLCQNQINEEIM